MSRTYPQLGRRVGLAVEAIPCRETQLSIGIVGGYDCGSRLELNTTRIRGGLELADEFGAHWGAS